MDRKPIVSVSVNLCQMAAGVALLLAVVALEQRHYNAVAVFFGFAALLMVDSPKLDDWISKTAERWLPPFVVGFISGFTRVLFVAAAILLILVVWSVASGARIALM